MNVRKNAGQIEKILQDLARDKVEGRLGEIPSYRKQICAQVNAMSKTRPEDLPESVLELLHRLHTKDILQGADDMASVDGYMRRAAELYEDLDNVRLSRAQKALEEATKRQEAAEQALSQANSDKHKAAQALIAVKQEIKAKQTAAIDAQKAALNEREAELLAQLEALRKERDGL